MTKQVGKAGGAKKKGTGQKPKPTTKPEKEAARPSGWARLSKSTKAVVALIGTTAVAAAVPGVLPYASDRVLDLFGTPIVDVSSAIGSSYGISEAAAEDVRVTPPDVTTDPRFVPAGSALAKLTLEGKRSAAVSILDVSVEVIERRPPRRGTLIYLPPQGEDDNTVIDLNLDAPKPIAAAPGGSDSYFVNKHITLGHGELWVIHVHSRTTQHEYAWRLHLHLRYRGSDSELTVPPAGSPPFRMTAYVAPGDYMRQFVSNGGGDVIAHDCVTDKATCAAAQLPTVKSP